MKYFYFKPSGGNDTTAMLALCLVLAYIVIVVALLWMFIVWSYDVRVLRGLSVVILFMLVFARLNRLAQSKEK